MDVGKWPMGQIMQLPDSAFGTRWPIGVAVETPDADARFDISEAGLPERCVIWELVAVNEAGLNASVEIRMALGDFLPTTDAEFNRFQMLFSGIDSVYGARSSVNVPLGFGGMAVRLRAYVETGGQRLVCRFIRQIGSTIGAQLIIVVSAVPTEVPDCLLSV